MSRTIQNPCINWLKSYQNNLYKFFILLYQLTKKVGSGENVKQPRHILVKMSHVFSQNTTPSTSCMVSPRVCSFKIICHSEWRSIYLAGTSHLKLNKNHDIGNNLYYPTRTTQMLLQCGLLLGIYRHWSQIA